MTREEMEELNGLAASMGLYEDRNPCKRAAILGKAIKELEQEPTTKNDLEVDCISRAYLLDDSKYHTVFNDDTGNFEDVVYREDIEKSPSVTPQEPFKPMVEIDLYSVIKQKYIEREVLNKIKSEIDGLTYYWYEVHPRDVIDDVLEIIDKYKSESEVNNGTDSN